MPDCSGCRPVVAAVYFRIFFEKFVKSAVNGANQDPLLRELRLIFRDKSQNPLNERNGLTRKEPQLTANRGWRRASFHASL